MTARPKTEKQKKALIRAIKEGLKPAANSRCPEQWRSARNPCRSRIMSDEIQQGRGQASPSLACSAFERAAQLCRYYLKHQNHPSRWEDKSGYEQGVQITCENLAELMLEEAGKVEAGASLEEMAANWERAGFGSVAAAIRDLGQNTESSRGEAGTSEPETPTKD
jgi:hypothetical protein